jgi:hypothetical protein
LDINDKNQLETLAKNAVQCLGYFFGAVDIIYNENAKKYYVLETNSRPGIEGTTAEKYAEALLKYFENSEKEEQEVPTGIRKETLQEILKRTNLSEKMLVEFIKETYRTVSETIKAERIHSLKRINVDIKDFTINGVYIPDAWAKTPKKNPFLVEGFVMTNPIEYNRIAGDFWTVAPHPPIVEQDDQGAF